MNHTSTAFHATRFIPSAGKPWALRRQQSLLWHTAAKQNLTARRRGHVPSGSGGVAMAE